MDLPDLEDPFTFISESPEATASLAAELATRLVPGDVLLLKGDLGVGKTHFVRGLCRGLGMKDPWEVDSPTFTLINHYHAGPGVFHLDLYRIDSTDELEQLGLGELGSGSEILVVEWPEKLVEYPFGRGGYLIELKYGPEFADERRIRIRQFGIEVLCPE